MTFSPLQIPYRSASSHQDFGLKPNRNSPRAESFKLPGKADENRQSISNLNAPTPRTMLKLGDKNFVSCYNCGSELKKSDINSTESRPTIKTHTKPDGNPCESELDNLKITPLLYNTEKGTYESIDFKHPIIYHLPSSKLHGFGGNFYEPNTHLDSVFNGSLPLHTDQQEAGLENKPYGIKSRL